MPAIKILCPWHGLEETITLPEGYVGPEYSTFSGDVPCGGGQKEGCVLPPSKPILQIEFEHLGNNVIRIRKLSLKQ